MSRSRIRVGLKETHLITDLRQVKALSDPLRQQIIGALATEPRTTKQVADRLGLPATRLYRHVELLHKAGLIELVETRPKRGTTEKYFRAIAHRFEVADQTLSGEVGTLLEEAFANAFSAARAELRRAVECGVVGTEPDASKTVLALGTLRLTPKSLAKLQERLSKIAGGLGSPTDEEAVPYRMLVAVYPSSEPKNASATSAKKLNGTNLAK